MSKNYTLNVVGGYNPYDDLTDMYDSLGNPVISPFTGRPRQTLRVDAKKTWFRKTYPVGASTLEIIENNDDYIIVKACVYKDTNTEQLPLGTGFSQQEKISNRQYPPLESAATLALGNALDDAGFGCEISKELTKEELEFVNETTIPNAQPTPVHNENNSAYEPEECDEEEIAGAKPEIKPLKKAPEVIFSEDSEDEFAAFGVEAPAEESTDEEVTEKSSEKTHKEAPVKEEKKKRTSKSKVEKSKKAEPNNDSMVKSEENIPEFKQETTEETVSVIDTEHVGENSENIEATVESEHTITLLEAEEYIIQPEDNIAASAQVEDFVGERLGSLKERILFAMYERYGDKISETLKKHIAVLINK